MNEYEYVVGKASADKMYTLNEVASAKCLHLKRKLVKKNEVWEVKCNHNNEINNRN